MGESRSEKCSKGVMKKWEQGRNVAQVPVHVKAGRGSPGNKEKIGTQQGGQCCSKQRNRRASGEEKAQSCQGKGPGAASGNWASSPFSGIRTGSPGSGIRASSPSSGSRARASGIC